MEAVLIFIATILGTLTSVFIPNKPPLPTVTPTPPPIERMQFKDELTKWPYSIKYTIWIPENGGAAEGTMKGYGLGVPENCTAVFKGTYKGGEGGNIQGTIEGNCEVPLLGGTIIGTLEGNVYPTKGYMESRVKGKIGDTTFNEYVYSRRY